MPTAALRDLWSTLQSTANVTTAVAVPDSQHVLSSKQGFAIFDFEIGITRGSAVLTLLEDDRIVDK